MTRRAARRRAAGPPTAVLRPAARPRQLIERAETAYRDRRLAEAEALYREAITTAPGAGAAAAAYIRCFASARLGAINRDQGRYAEAGIAYQEALKTPPSGDGAHAAIFAAAANNLGGLLREMRRLADSRRALLRGLKVHPTADLLVSLGTTLRQLGDVAGAAEAYRQALVLDPDCDRARFGLCISQLPVIHAESDEIAASRERYRQALQALSDHYAAAPAEVRARAAGAVGFMQPFYLAYQGMDDRALQSLYGGTVCSLMAARYPQWSRRPAFRDPGPGDRLRIGFVSRFFFTSHSVWKMRLKGWAETIDRDRFELYGYHTRAPRPGAADPDTSLFSRFAAGSRTVAEWAEIIAADRLDALIYPEIGMDPMSIQLGSLWLAPLQMTSWSHPTTSGLPTIGYYLSSDLMEPDNGQDLYTERLVRLPNLGVHYTPLDIVPEEIERAALGVGEGETLFWCCQSLYKYLPAHDDVFPRIARELGACKFLFIADSRAEGDITGQFRARLGRAFADAGLDADAYCLFRPYMPKEAFAGICRVADVFLDSIGWSGCNTALEAVAQHLPIVTLPGTMMRGRHALAILQMMGIDETIAATKEDYVRIAVRLAREPAFRERMAAALAGGKHRLYRDPAPLRALEDLLLVESGRMATEARSSITAP